MASSEPLLDQDGVRLTVDDALATVTLANPAKRNAQSPAMWRALAEAGRLLPGAVRVVVLRGEGKSFSAGLDRQMFTPEGIEGEPSFIDLARSGDADSTPPSPGSRRASPGGGAATSCRSPPSRGTPSARASSWPSPVTCASSPTTCSSRCARPAWASCPT